MKQIATLVLLALLVGCNAPRQFKLTEPPPAEVPVMNLPVEMRVRNWVSRNQQGSCVHASSVMLFKWLGEEELADKWRNTYSGGETASSILRYWKQAGIPYCSTYDERSYTSTGDPEFLKWCSDTRRGAIIWWKPSHCCVFCGFTEINGEQYAIILDNNTPNKFDEPIPVNEFIRRWRGYGGFAATPVLSPTGPLPWPIVTPISEEI